MLEIVIPVDSDLTSHTADIDTLARNAFGDGYAGVSVAVNKVRLHFEDGYGEPIPVYTDDGSLLHYTIAPDETVFAVVEAIQAFAPS